MLLLPSESSSHSATGPLTRLPSPSREASVLSVTGKRENRSSFSYFSSIPLFERAHVYLPYPSKRVSTRTERSFEPISRPEIPKNFEETLNTDELRVCSPIALFVPRPTTLFSALNEHASAASFPPLHPHTLRRSHRVQREDKEGKRTRSLRMDQNGRSSVDRLAGWKGKGRGELTPPTFRPVDDKNKEIPAT